MFLHTKKDINAKLRELLRTINQQYELESLSPLLYKHLKEFVLRDGKRLRPIFFLTGYHGHAASKPPNLLETALSIELVHDFMLIHDDIIDKSQKRRSNKSLHCILQDDLKRFDRLKFNGSDLAMILGDIIYAISIEAFLSVEEKPQRKEAALKEFIRTATFTGIGQFLELMAGTIPLSRITLDQIYRIYEYKTALYTFAAPLKTGAILAGAPVKESEHLATFGVLLGKAFQIKDDIADIFTDKKKTDKSLMLDLHEAKRTVLLYHAYHKSGPSKKKTIDQILNKKTLTAADLKRMKAIMRETGAYNTALDTVHHLCDQATSILQKTHLRKKQKQFLNDYTHQVKAHW
jgi:geranylgeranyl diphosphate synthase type I